MKVPHDCGLVSFDVTSLFTNVPLVYTIDVILRKVYEEKLIKTDRYSKERDEGITTIVYKKCPLRI